MFTNIFTSKKLLRLFALLTILVSLLGVWNIPSARAQSGTTLDGNTPVQSPILQPVTDPQQLLMLNTQSTDVVPGDSTGFVAALSSDTRVRVTPTTSAPWQYIVRILFVYPNGSSKVCTGFFIGPDTVITAGHCVQDMTRVKNPGDVGGWAVSAVVYPGYDAGIAPFGYASGVILYSTVGWVQNQDPLYDYGAIYLDAPLGNTTSYFDYGYFSDNYLNTFFTSGVATIAGYPLDKESLCDGFSNASCMWADTGPVTLTPQILNYGISTDPDVPASPNTTAGQDGSPIWINDSGNVYVIGINLFSTGNPLCSVGKNCGLRITKAVADNLYNWSKKNPLTDPMGAGIYDDSSASWVFSGTWYTYSTTGPYNGTLHYTDAIGALATFTFSGKQFIFYYGTHTNRGSFEVWVDKTYVTTVNAYSATLVYQNKYTSPEYKTGVHTVTIKFVGPSGLIDADAIQIISPPGAGKYDDTDMNWVYGGTWYPYSTSGPYNGTLHYSTAVGATASFTFNGKQFTLFYGTHTNRASFEVWVDDALVTTINAYSTTLVYQVPYTSPVYTVGYHTVTIKNIGPSGIVDIDAIEIVIPDLLPPSAVGGLSATTGTTNGSIDVYWTAPVNDNGYPASGAVKAYQVRYSQTNIVTEADWNAATPVTTGIPTPGGGGSAQKMTIGGLIPSLLYYVTVRGQDISNLGPIVTSSATAKASVPQGRGKYDDNDANWVYSGTWYLYGATGPYNNSLHYTDQKGAMASFTFNGNQFILSYSTHSNRGSFEVWVDGVNVKTINAYSVQLVYQNTYTSPVYTTGVHTVTIKYIGPSGIIDVDAIQIIAPPGPGKYDDNDPSWVYNGKWYTFAGTGPYNDSLHYSSTVGATASFTFYGSQFVLSYGTHTNRCSFEVWVDGSLVTTVNAYSPTLVYQVTYTSPVYTTGEHVVMVKNVGPSGIVDVDAIQIIVIQGQGKYDDNDSMWIYSGKWYTYSTSGPYLGTLHYSTTVGAAASFTFNGNRFIFSYGSHTNRCSFEVWVDGSLVTTINAYSAQLVYQNTYTSPLYTNGVHTMTIKNIGPSGIVDVDAIQIIAPQGPGKYDDIDASWVYGGGTWSPYTTTGPYNGTLHYTSTVGATASFTLNGSQFVLSYGTHTNRASFEVWVDGSLVTTINAYSATLVYQVLYTSPVYTAGVHTVIIKNVGPMGIVDVDAIQVLP